MYRYWHVSSREQQQQIKWIVYAIAVCAVDLIAFRLFATGMLGDALPAESIDHTGPRPAAPEPAVSVAYGEYLVRAAGCRACHGQNLAGGKGPNPKAPPAPDITQRGELRLWSEEIFIAQARTRDGEFMPWKLLNRTSDDELKAVWLYLKSLPSQ